MYYTDLNLVRSALKQADLPERVKQAYLQVLENLNVISVLIAPGDALEEDAAEEGEPELMKLFAVHQRRRTALEKEHPLLLTLTRPQGWRAN